MNTTPLPAGQPLLVPAAEAAKMLSIGKSTFWHGVKQGTLPAPVKIAGVTRWRVADLHNAVSSALSAATSAAAATAAAAGAPASRPTSA